MKEGFEEAYTKSRLNYFRERAGWEKWELAGKKYSLGKIITRQGTYLRKLPSSSADCLPGLIGKLTALTFDTEWQFWTLSTTKKCSVSMLITARKSRLLKTNQLILLWIKSC